MRQELPPSIEALPVSTFGSRRGRQGTERRSDGKGGRDRRGEEAARASPGARADAFCVLVADAFPAGRGGRSSDGLVGFRALPGRGLTPNGENPFSCA